MAICMLWRYSRRSNSGSKNKSRTHGQRGKFLKRLIIPLSWKWIALSRLRKNCFSFSITAQVVSCFSISVKLEDLKKLQPNSTLPIYYLPWNACMRMESSTESKLLYHLCYFSIYSLKPENILIDKDGFAKLTDFGLSKDNIMGD